MGAGGEGIRSFPALRGPHHPLSADGKVVSLRDAPSSPSDGVGSFVVLAALGEEGVWGDWWVCSFPALRGPHRPLAADGKVVSLRDAPSPLTRSGHRSPSDGVGSFVMLAALGEEGVWG